jgi:muramidase (phage lysozyme)
MGKSSGGQNTVETQSAPPAQFLNAYSGAVSNAQNLAAQPYQQYSGSLLAPLNNEQLNAAYNAPSLSSNATPYLNEAQQYFQNAATPITATPFSTSQVNQYLSPYTQDVTSSLQNLFNQQNATQLSQVQGNAAAQGAFGGDREAVAAAQTAGQQQAQEAPVLAQNLQTGYNTALGEFNAQQQANLQAQQATGWLQQGAGYGVANLGQENYNIGQGTLGTEASLGGLLQQQAQEGLNIPYEQFIAQQSYPYQEAGWEANIAEGLGGASGGTSSTQYPGPSALSQVAGLGLTGTGILGATGAFGSGGYLTGAGGLADELLGNAGSFAPAAGAASDAALALGPELSTATDFSGGLAGAGAAIFGAQSGGRIPRQDGGGSNSSAAPTPTSNALQSLLVNQLLYGGGSGSDYAAGGRIRRQAGGPLSTPYSGLTIPGMPTLQSAMGQANAPQGPQPAQPPNLSSGYVPTPPPSAGGRGIPTGAGAGMQQQQQQPVMQALQTLQALKGLKGLFPGDSSDTPAASAGGAVTLSTPYQGFDDGGAAIQQAGQSGTGGGNPLSQGLLQQYLQLPLEQLQELAQRAPPTTPQGQSIQRALQLKHMNPGSGIGGAGAPQPPASPQGLAATPAPTGPATSGLSPVLAANWRGGRIGRQEGGDIPGLSVAADSAFAQPQSPDVDIPGVSIATAPNAQVLTQKGDEAPQKAASQMVPGGAGLAAPPKANATSDLPTPSLANPPRPESSTAATTLDNNAPPSLGGRGSLPDAKSIGVNPLVYNYLVNHVAPGESRGNPNALYGSGTFSDMAQHPADAGWKGGTGPGGQPTHAAGLLQDEPDTWHRIQLATGVSDFSPASQIKGNAWLAQQTYHDRTGRDLATDLAAGKTAQVDQALSGQWPSLASKQGGKPSLANGPQLGSGAASGPALTAPFSQDNSGGGGGGLTLADLAKLMGNQNQRTPTNEFYSSPWMPLIAAGAGMLASRSPYPGVALGEGLETGLKTLGSQQSEIPENQLREAQAQTAQITNALLPIQMQALAGGQGAPSGGPLGQPSGTTGTSGAGSAAVTGSPASAAGATPSGGPPLTPGTVQGASGMPEPANMGQNPQFAGLDSQYQAIGAQIAQLKRIIPLYPQHAPELTASLASQMDNYTKLMLGDPRMQAQAEAMKDWAAVAPKAVQAENEAESRYNNTATRAPPGSYMYRGSQVVGATPTVRTVTDPGSGAKSEQFFAPPLPGQQGASPATQQGPAATQSPAGAGAPAEDGALGKSWQTELGPGQKVSLEDRAKIEQAGREETLKEAQSAQNQQSTLNVMKDNAASIYTGPGASYVGDFNKIARLVDPAYDDTVAARESFLKNGGNLIRQATRELSPRAAFQEVRFVQSTLPNPDMSPKGLNAVIGELQGLNDYKIAKANAQAQWETEHGGVGHVEGFESDWQAKAPVTPYTFIISRMPQNERQELFGRMATTDEGRAQLQRFAQERQTATANGWTQ